MLRVDGTGNAKADNGIFLFFDLDDPDEVALYERAQTNPELLKNALKNFVHSKEGVARSIRNPTEAQLDEGSQKISSSAERVLSKDFSSHRSSPTLGPLTERAKTVILGALLD